MSLYSNSEETSKWMRDIGAVRPMATANQNILVLGKWQDGFYPIECLFERSRNGQIVESWRIFGIPTKYMLEKEDCKRILKACQPS